MSTNPHGYGPYSVTILPHFILKLKDGTELALRVWYPTPDPEKDNVFFPGDYERKPYRTDGVFSNPGNEKFPTIMEYLPYRKGDSTSIRDHLRHPWLATHGYVFIRVDIRGSGDSTGLYFDEYTHQELLDACEVIEWISKQDWSNEKVGMYGKSWGGFNGLQVAYYQPPALKAVISLYSTDNRYTDDVHYRGGSILGNGMLSWSSVMYVYNARAPNPKNLPKNWKQEWRKRLEEGNNPWIDIWLNHQTYDKYWKHGSICEDYSKVTIPILAIGGWIDGYTDAVFRMTTMMPNVQGIVGPWSHDWPDVATPGPHIGFMNLNLDFWNKHLKGIKPEKELSKFTWFQWRGILPPSPNISTIPGEWHQTDSAQLPTVEKKFICTDSFKLKSLELEDPPINIKQDSWELEYNLNAGIIASGEWIHFGGPDHPGDQHQANLISTSWTTVPFTDRTNVIGIPVFKCGFIIKNDTQGIIIVRLSDVFPNKTARLISWGAQNLNEITKNQPHQSLEKGKRYTVEVNLDSLGYEIQVGHKLCISVSPVCFPFIWTPRKETQIVIDDAQLIVPLLENPSKSRLLSSPFPKEINLGPPLNIKVMEKPTHERYLKTSLSSGFREVVNESYSGKIHYIDEEMTLSRYTKDSYEINENDPMSAKAICKNTVIQDLKSIGETVIIETENTMKSDYDNFILNHKIHVKTQFDKIYSNEFETLIPRKYQ